MKPLTPAEWEYLLWVHNETPRSSAVPLGWNDGYGMEVRRSLLKAGLIHFVIRPDEKTPRQAPTDFGRDQVKQKLQGVAS